MRCQRQIQPAHSQKHQTQRKRENVCLPEVQGRLGEDADSTVGTDGGRGRCCCERRGNSHRKEGWLLLLIVLVSEKYVN